jgi:pimeloyl-ACP methyl ester carboxylesterase
LLRVTLPDGRQLEYVIYGDEDGFPVVYCHGFPASHLEASLFLGDIQKAHVRLIVPNRPGYGGSDYQPRRRIVDWTKDVHFLCDHLDLDHYSVLGVSGGAPYAVSCGINADSRLRRVGLVCGLGPLVDPQSTEGMGLPPRLFIALSRQYPQLAISLYARIIGPLMRRVPGLVIGILRSAAPPCDREIFRRGDYREIYKETFRFAFKQGGLGPAWDLYLYTHPWEMDFTEVKVATHLWHGEADHTVPVEMGYDYAAWIPGCEAEYYPDEGHFSLPLKKMGQVLLWLKGEGKKGDEIM